jgi:hypothetical protein
MAMSKNVFREARLILPAAGEIASIREIESRLVSAFGGFTKVTGWGAWRDPNGLTDAEAVYVYDIACPAFDASEPDRAWLGSEIALREIARDAARLLKQECIYVRMPFGDVYLIRPDGKSYNADAASAPHPRASDFWRARNAGIA